MQFIRVMIDGDSRTACTLDERAAFNDYDADVVRALDAIKAGADSVDVNLGAGGVFVVERVPA